MDLYLKTLSVSNRNTIQDVAYPCMKLLDWIYKAAFFSNDQLSSKDVSNLAKAVIYLNACSKIHGEELTQYLVENYNFYEDTIKTYFRTTSKPLAPIAHIFANVAKRNDSAALLCCLESIFNLYSQQSENLDQPTSISLNYEPLAFIEDDDLEISENKLILIDLLQSLFQLPFDQIDLAVKRALNNLPFSIIGLVFCDPLDSFYTDIYCIMADKICEQISSFTVSKFFIRSLYYAVSTSNSGRELFWLCLANVYFAKAMETFIVKCILESFQQQQSFFESLELLTYKEHKLCHILFLAWTAMAPLSPCHKNFCKSILEVNVDLAKFTSNVLSNFDSIFE